MPNKWSIAQTSVWCMPNKYQSIRVLNTNTLAKLEYPCFLGNWCMHYIRNKKVKEAKLSDDDVFNWDMSERESGKCLYKSNHSCSSYSHQQAKNEQSHKRRKKAEWKSELELTPHSPPLSKLYKDKRERKSVSAEWQMGVWVCIIFSYSHSLLWNFCMLALQFDMGLGKIGGIEG